MDRCFAHRKSGPAQHFPTLGRRADGLSLKDTLAQWLSDPAPPGSALMVTCSHWSPLLVGGGSPVLPERPEQTSPRVPGPTAQTDSQGDRPRHVPLDFTVAGGHVFFQPRGRPGPEEGPAGHVAPATTPASLCTSCHETTLFGCSVQLGPGAQEHPVPSPLPAKAPRSPRQAPVSPSAPTMDP